MHSANILKILKIIIITVREEVKKKTILEGKLEKQLILMVKVEVEEEEVEAVKKVEAKVKIFLVVWMNLILLEVILNRKMHLLTAK